MPGVRLVGNPKYLGIAYDFTTTVRVLKSLPCDIFLAPHGFLFGLEPKTRRLASGEQPNPFIDPEGYKAFIDRSEQVFLRQWEREQRGHPLRQERNSVNSSVNANTCPAADLPPGRAPS